NQTRAFPSQTTEYLVFGGDANGCIDNATVTVVVHNFPVTSLPDTTDMCLGDTLLLFGAPTQPGVIYQWSPPIGIVPGFQGLGTIRVSPPASISYTLRIRNANYDCGERVDSIYVRVTPKPGLLFGGNPQIRCSNGSGVVLDAAFQNQTSGPCTISWSPGQTLDNPAALQPTAFPSATTTYTIEVDCGTLCVLRDSVTVFVNPAPNILATANNILICAGSGGEPIQTYITGGTPPLYYTWFPSHGLSDIYSPSPVANPDRDTTYRLVVTDSWGCQSDTAYVRVTVHPLPYADAGRDTFICAGVNEGVFLNGTGFFPPGTPPQYMVGGFSYRWRPAYALSNPNIPNPYATPDTTTTYQLVVYSNFGCASDSTNLNAVSTVTVYVRSRPVADAGFTEYRICAGDSVKIGDLPTGQGPDYTFYWTPSTGMNDSTLLQPTVSPPYTFVYFQKAFSNGCESVADTVLVVVERAPTVALDDNVEICRAYSTTLEPLVTLDGSTNVRYRWQPSVGLSDPEVRNPTAAPDTTTTYTLFVYHGPGCPPVLDSIRVNVFPSPYLIANPNDTIIVLCEAAEGDSATLPARVVEILPGLPYTVRWSPTEGLSDPNVLNPRVKPSESTDYVAAMRVKDCWYYDTIRVRVRPFVTARIEGLPAICATDTARLVGFGGIGAADFVWRWRDENGVLHVDSSRGGTSDTLVAFPLVSTVYSLTVKEGGCTQTDTFRLLVVDARSPRIFHNYPLGGCDSLSVSFADSTEGAIAWRWNFGDGSPVSNLRHPRHTYRRPGVYRVETEVYFAQGCSKVVYTDVNFKVNVVAGAADFDSDPSAPVVLYMPQSVVRFFDRSPGAAAWHWDFGDGGVSTQPNPVYEFRIPGDYLVTLTTTDSIGCQSSKTKGLYKVIAPEIVVPTIFSPNGDGVNDYWRVLAPGKTGVNVKIYDRWGTLFYDMTDDLRGWDGTQMGSGRAAPGVYFYYIKIGDEFYDGSLTLVR
ncbi:MAG: PKD domain-containing protein, partial [Bacteroidia bacterium]|nr:PKD domain-containing protein [Bacteroidia bacterium]